MKITCWLFRKRVGAVHFARGLCVALAAFILSTTTAEAVVLHMFMPNNATKLYEEPRGTYATNLNFALDKAFPDVLVSRAAVRDRLGKGWEECVAQGAEGWVAFKDRTLGPTKYRYQYVTYYRKGEELFIVSNRFLDDVIPPDDAKSSRPSHSLQEAVLRLVDMSDEEFKKIAESSKLKCAKY